MPSPKASTSLSILVPVYNEQYLVRASLERLTILCQSPLLERIQIVVVNDGSTDRTADVLSEFQRLQAESHTCKLQWLFLQHDTNQGKAAAIHTALSQATCELTVIHDADLEYHPLDLLKMVRVFLDEDADAVFGSRFLASEYRRVLFFRHQLGNHFLTLLCNIVSDLNLTDVETCYKMVSTRLLKSVPLEGKGFEIEPEIAIKLAKRGARVFEVPIRYAGRTYQEGKKITWKDGIRAITAILRFGSSDHIYAEDVHGSQILSRLNRAPRFTKWMADVIRPYVGEKVLEIGAGTGNLTMQLIPRELYWASDINPLYLTYLESVSRNRPYLRVGYTDGQAGESYPGEEKFDTVICLNVVEHLEDDLGALQNIRAALQEGGRAIILVPCGPWLMGTLDEVLGHQRRYTRNRLTDLVTQAGFHLETMLEFNRIGVIAWWLNGRLLRRRTFGLWQIKILNLLTPLFRVLDRYLPLPPLSLIAILNKPSPQ
ncbi:MAG TPA: bifunctional glycosyltransferase/class I SAM-dependent methyltransferase [Candidatus Acidoferrum sp.]|nr:bifunctional glycosyltransferase/class I SAM-dependent methyltransferase [Candidatus Acidoferrum sp.]